MAFIKMALDLEQGLKPDTVTADKAYAAEWLLHYFENECIEVIITPKADQLNKIQIDHKAHRQRNVIERTK